MHPFCRNLIITGEYGIHLSLIPAITPAFCLVDSAINGTLVILVILVLVLLILVILVLVVLVLELGTCQHQVQGNAQEGILFTIGPA